MENKKDIGKAISDKLSSLDKSPKEQVWSGISYELDKRKKRRIGFFFFWSKVVGVLLIGSMIGFYIYSQNNGFSTVATDSKKDSIIIHSVKGETSTTNQNAKNSESHENNKTKVAFDENGNTNDDNNIHGSKNGINGNNQIGSKNSESEKKDNNTNGNSGRQNLNERKDNKVSAKSSKSGSPKANTVKSAKSKAKLLSKSGKKKSGKKTQQANDTSGNTNTDLTSLQYDKYKSKLANTDLSSLEEKNSRDITAKQNTKKKDSIAEKKAKDKTININMYAKDSLKEDSEKKYRKFYVDAFISPTLYGYFSKGSPLDRDLDSLSKKSEIKLSYGFGITYDLTERVSVRIGYRKINLSNITKDAPVNVSDYSGISYEGAISNQTIYGMSDFSETMDITQTLSYTEIPLEVKYLILNKNFGIKSTFGFSYLLLNENKINIKTPNGFDMAIGKTKNLSGTSLSVNLGVEFDYPVFKNTKIFVEPMFNYQVKAFSDGNYKPYIFGIHTGLRYSLNNK